MKATIESPVRRVPTHHSVGQALIAQRDPMAAASEAFRVLRTNLQFLGLDKPLRSLLVTSSTPGEGKSTVAANLAIAFAQTGASVCLVDADLRRPMVAKLLCMDNWAGLTTALIGQAGLDNALRQTEVPGLSVLTSGPIPPNPAELLGSGRMTKLLEELSQRFEIVVVDTPPVLAVADAAVLAPKADGVLMVARAGRVARQQMARAKEALVAVKANVLGVVLDCVPPHGREGYYYYYYSQSHDGEHGGKRT